MFWCHFAGAFCAGRSSNIIGSSINNILLNGNYWVCIFCILSGYLADQKRINSVKELLAELALRYLKFVIHFFFMVLLVYFISIAVGFHTLEWSKILENPWLEDFYSRQITAADAAKSIFLFSSVLNGPMWVMKHIFLGNCMIYIYNFCAEKFRILEDYKKNIMLLGAGCSVFAGFLKNIESWYIACCLLGGYLSFLWKNKKKNSNKMLTVLLIGWTVLFGGLHNALLSRISSIFSLPTIFYEDSFWNMIYAFSFLVLANEVKITKMIFENKFLQRACCLSFPIYLIHWPLICSVSLQLYGKLAEHYPYVYAKWLNFALCNFIVMGAAGLYACTCDRWNFKILKRLRNRI